MAEETQGQEKTEEATPRKLQKAKDDGQVARSRELNSVAVVTFGAIAAIATVPSLATEIMSLATQYFQQAASTSKPLTFYLSNAILGAFWFLLPLTLILFVAGIASSVAVGGMVLSAKAFTPKLERMSLIKGFGRMFSAKSAVELGKSIAKFVLISGVTVAVLSTFLDRFLVLGALPVEGAIAQGVEYVAIAFVLVGAALIVVAMMDIPFQIAQHKKQLKMTKQEVRDELKDVEGKPEVKAKIRSLQQQVAQRKMLEEVPNADVVITNPEHYSVAVKYEQGSMAAPLLVAKGVDHMALKIREVAGGADVPIVEVPPLARAIYFSTEIEEEIPEALYIAVAQVLAYVYQLDLYKRGQLDREPMLGQVDVNPELDPEGGL